MVGGLGDSGAGGSGGASLGNSRPTCPQMAEIGLGGVVRYYPYAVFWVMFICVMVVVSI